MYLAILAADGRLFPRSHHSQVPLAKLGQIRRPNVPKSLPTSDFGAGKAEVPPMDLPLHNRSCSLNCLSKLIRNVVDTIPTEVDIIIANSGEGLDQ